MAEVNFQVDEKSIAVASAIRITANFDETEAQLREMLAPYERMVVTEDSVGTAKSDLARIRKLKKSLDDYRKSVKKAFTAPVTAFEARVKQLTAIADGAEDNLSAQINDYAERAKAEKYAALKAFFNDVAEDVRGYVTFEQISNPRWGNTTFDTDDAKEEIRAAVGRILDGLNAIRDLGSPYETSLLDEYKRNHDLTAALRKHRELTELAQREEARKAALKKAQEEAEERRKTEEAAQAVIIKDMAPERRPDPEPPVQEPVNVPLKEQVYTVRFEVEATAKQLNVLKSAMQKIGVTFRGIR